MEANEEWLIQRARQCIKTDPHTPKAWLLTARTLFPKSFPVQYEAYTLEKSCKNVREVAKLLEEMFVGFPTEAQLWTEVTSLSEALQSENVDDKTSFLKAVFAALPANLQCHMLMRIAETSSDVLQQCRLMLLVLSRYPEQVADQGVKLIDSLLTTEKHSQSSCPVNCYRKYLVCNVLPVVLKMPLPISAKQLYRWLQKAIEFYVCYLMQPPVQDTPSPLSPDLKSPTGKVTYGGGGSRRVVIPGLTEKESYIESPWTQLFELLTLMAKHLQWDMEDFLHKPDCGAQWQWLQTLWESTTELPDPTSIVKQVLYCTAVLFMSSLYKYICQVDPQLLLGGGGSNHPPAVLIEAFKTDGPGSSPEHKMKKLKRESHPPKINGNKNLSNSNEVIETFHTALRCWELLHSSDVLEKEFNKLCQHWKADSWLWLRSFEIDVLIYQGYFKEAVSKLQAYQNLPLSPASKLRTGLQIACCYYCLGNYGAACERVLGVVSSLPVGTETIPQLLGYSGPGRQLQLLVCNETEVLPYCIQLMITSFKEKAFKTSLPSDMSLGHMLVLMQYDWPKYETLFCDIVAKIKRQGHFSYNLFFNYVVNIDILEEFAYLKTPEGGQVTLDIMPVSSKALSQTRTVTRGVNKGVKEDFKVAMEKQVSRSTDHVESVLRDFFVEEKDILRQNLS